MEAEVSTAQVLFCLFHVLGGHSQFFVGFANLELALGDLEFYLFLSLGEFQVSHGGGSFRGAYLVFALHPVPEGYVNEYADVPYATELITIAVVDIGIGGQIAASECDMGEVGSTHDLGGLVGDIDGILQQLQFRTVVDGRLYIHVGSRRGEGDILLVFVGERDLGVDGESAELTEEHLGEHQSVLCLHDIHLGLIDLHLHLEAVGIGGHTLADHLLHIAVELSYHFQEAVGQTFLLPDADHLPVCLVDAVEGVLQR